MNIKLFLFLAIISLPGCSLGFAMRSSDEMLLLSAYHNEIHLVQKALDNGANINCEYTLFFRSALHMSAANGNINMLKLLLEKNANINIKDCADETALHIAVYHQNLDMIKLLLNAGADVNLKNRNGETVLDLARSNENIDEFFENWLKELRKLRKKVKEETASYLIPVLGDIVADYVVGPTKSDKNEKEELESDL